MRPITAVTLAGTVSPILFGGIAAVCDLRMLALVAIGLAVVLPSIGHIVYRRTIRTRGFYTRLGGAGFTGLMLLATANAKDLGGAIAFTLAAMFTGVVAYGTGAMFDILDSARVGREVEKRVAVAQDSRVADRA
jgi:hypothetical protein